jgi:predicted amidophosphoribosyltransferase
MPSWEQVLPRRAVGIGPTRSPPRPMMTTMIEVHPARIPGRWREGYSFDVHTVSSTYVGDDEYGHPRFESQRSPAGELLYWLKYKAEKSAAPELVEAAVSFIRSWDPGVDLLVPVAPSRARPLQPVLLLGEAIAESLRIEFSPGSVRRAREVPQLKDIFGYDETWRLLAGLHEVDPAGLDGGRVLLFDDLFRSGATMNSIAAALYDDGRIADRVCVDHDKDAKPPVTKVFIGGSRRISRLTTAVRQRLDRIVEKGLPVVIGDANGADKAVQAYLLQQRYSPVEVFCSDEVPRNNLGAWPSRVIQPSHARRDVDYYATKDRQMAREATVGLMLWDGESRGTLLNILRLVTLTKPVVVYVGPERVFVDVRSARDFESLASKLDRADARRLREQALSEGLVDTVETQAQLRL